VPIRRPRETVRRKTRRISPHTKQSGSSRAFAIQQLAHGADPSVHHVTRRDGIRAGTGIVQRDLRQRLDGGVILDRALRRDVTAVTVVGGATEADIRPDDQLRTGILDGGDRLGRQALRIQCGAGLRVLVGVRGSRENQTAGTPAATAFASFTISSTESWKCPACSIGVAHPRPGYCEQRVDERVEDRRVSRTMRRQASDCRVLRGLCEGNPISALRQRGLASFAITVCGLRQPLQGGRLGQRGRVAALGQRLGGRRSDRNSGAADNRRLKSSFPRACSNSSTAEGWRRSPRRCRRGRSRSGSPQRPGRSPIRCDKPRPDHFGAELLEPAAMVGSARELAGNRMRIPGPITLAASNASTRAAALESSATDQRTNRVGVTPGQSHGLRRQPSGWVAARI
jgi:hypothetical protein